ncbi:MAG: anthranilate phosphoribosyltransferase [Acidimicrobiales bacterium]|jgi:anthranilate phosphoribosyltransferase|nr:anthranilate phosphoribosyltransferase [Acidimicrobiales bacterium]
MALEAFGGWAGVLGELVERRDLDRDTARSVLEVVLAGEATPAQIAALVVALRMKGETVEELSGLVDAMVAAAQPLHLPEGTIDIVGVGGSASRRRHALNVSTIACFVAAAAGATVCKHGNRRASSTSGSFDLLEQLGVGIDLDAAGVERCVRETGVGFAFARTFHPAMRHAAPVRAEIGIPTVFNVLGPLSHPGRVTRHVIGVADPALGDRMIHVLAARGSVHALVVTGDGGLDEFSTTGPARVLELRDGQVRDLVVDPEALGLRRATPDELAGGDAVRNAELARALLAGERSAHRDIVLLNAAAGLYVADRVADFAEGLEAAAAAVDDGRAAATLASLVECSRRPAT